jgi:hypothetical protein
VNRTPPRPEVVEPGVTISKARLAVVGTLVRTYDWQRRRLLERAGVSESSHGQSPLRPLNILEFAVMLDGRPVSASILDLAAHIEELVARPIEVPFLDGSGTLAAAEAGWWDALIGDVERRTGLAPRSVIVALPSRLPETVRAVFADRALP